jgi:hypothetical protein
LRRRPMARQAAGLNRRDHPLTKINRVRFAHPCWPPFPASMLNQNPPDLGILNRFRLNSYRSNAAHPTNAFMSVELPWSISQFAHSNFVPLQHKSPRCASAGGEWREQRMNVA